MPRYENYHVYPVELEAILHTHPSVSECLAFGVSDPKVMEIVTMAAVLKQGHEARKGCVECLISVLLLVWIMPRSQSPT